MIKEIKIPFHIGQYVYFKTDEDQKKHIVTGIIIRQTGIKIEVSIDGYVNEVYDFELSSTVNQLIKLGVTE